MDSTSRLLCDIFSATIECEKVFICLYQTVLHHYTSVHLIPFFILEAFGEKECTITSSVIISTYFFRMNLEQERHHSIREFN